MIRNRDLFKLYRVEYRNNLNEPSTALVWAHQMSDALRVVEEYASREPRRCLSNVTGLRELSKPDTDTEDYASVMWIDGGEPVWS